MDDDSIKLDQFGLVPHKEDRERRKKMKDEIAAGLLLDAGRAR